jgi:hypothetical protein
MMLHNWQYDDLKNTLKSLTEDEGTLNKDVLVNCLYHFERYEKWMARLQEAYHFLEHDNKHYQRKLNKIKKILKQKNHHPLENKNENN